MKHHTKSNIAIRPELERRSEYKPGLSIEEIKRQYGLKKVIKLASNENPLGPSPRGESAYKKVSGGLFRYPESTSLDLRRVIAEKFRVDWQEVIVGAGSDEIIELLAKAYLTPADEIIVSASSFLQYRMAGELMGARIVTVPMKNMKHDLNAMANMVTPRTKFIFIANPNNPTGTYNTKSEMEELIAELPETVIPVVDEAYFEYASEIGDYPFCVQSFFKKKAIIVLRTFSKVYGLAGLRVGYGVAPEEIVRQLDKIRPAFNVSIPSQVAAQAALFDEGFIKKTLKLNEKEKFILAKALTEMGFEVIPSAANFLLFRVYPLTGRGLFEQLLRKGVVVRSVDEYGLPEYLRVTVGLPHENRIFLNALKEVITKK